MKRISVTLIALFIFSSLFAQQTWEGNAAMSRYGEFPSTGLYGASDSFSRNTVITVENLENNKKTTIIIVDRLDDPGLFLLLSREAASELGISADQFVRTRVTLADSRSRLSVNDADQAYHDDPDINPSATIEDEDLSFLQKYLTSDEPLILDPDVEPTVLPEEPVEEAPLIAQEPEEDQLPETTEIVKAEPEAVEVLPPITEEPTINENAEEPLTEEPIEEFVYEEPRLLLSRLGTAKPEKESVPPGQDVPGLPEAPRSSLYVEDTYAVPDRETADIAIADEPVLSAEEKRAILIAQQFPMPRPEVGDSLADISPSAPILVFESPVVADLEGAPPSETSPPAHFAMTDPALKEEGDVVVTLEKAEARPPENVPEEIEIPEEAPAAVEPEPPLVYGDGTYSVVQRLDASSHYLQIGAFREEYTAKSAASRFDKRFPVTLLQGGGIYRVLLGPLTPDESGALLVTVKALGYTDAFIQRGH